MTDREMVIKGLECCISARTCSECPYIDEYPEVCTSGECIAALMKDAEELLKAQEPRVMTLETILNEYRDAPLYLEIQGGGYCDWAYWYRKPKRGILTLRWYHEDEAWGAGVPLDEYRKTWRCWTSRPTDEQREAVKWDETD